MLVHPGGVNLREGPVRGKFRIASKYGTAILVYVEACLYAVHGTRKREYEFKLVVRAVKASETKLNVCKFGGFRLQLSVLCLWAAFSQIKYIILCLYFAIPPPAFSRVCAGLSSPFAGMKLKTTREPKLLGGSCSESVHIRPDVIACLTESRLGAFVSNLALSPWKPVRKAL